MWRKTNKISTKRPILAPFWQDFGMVFSVKKCNKVQYCVITAAQNRGPLWKD
jgi:hypothetical protein